MRLCLRAATVAAAHNRASQPRRIDRAGFSVLPRNRLSPSESTVERAGWTADFGERMDFTKLSGLVPAVVQDAETNEVLMVGFMNEAALAATRTTGFVTFFSRTRTALWTKGETSGNRLLVRQILVDCDEDTLLIRVERLGEGNVCHTGSRSCFTRELLPGQEEEP
jgi:phosphoribosyl-ATP pyrophosphohydrolase/phosphoribosyl-AMP cyclohydrolase